MSSDPHPPGEGASNSPCSPRGAGHPPHSCGRPRRGESMPPRRSSHSLYQGSTLRGANRPPAPALVKRQWHPASHTMSNSNKLPPRSKYESDDDEFTKSKPSITIRSISEYLNHIKRWGAGEKLLFRGQSQSWAPRPKLDRLRKASPESGRYPLPQDQLLLRHFQRLTRPHLPDIEVRADDWGWLAAAQHLGLPTRLLDWSENALVGLWFAVESARGKYKPAGDADQGPCVWLLHAPPQFWGLEDRGPFEVDGLRIIRPELLSPRISSQRGVFSLMRAREDLGTIENWVRNCENTGLKSDLIAIAADCCREIFQDLEQCGVDETSVYPDVDGAVRLLTRLAPAYANGAGVIMPKVWNRTNKPDGSEAKMTSRSGG